MRRNSSDIGFGGFLVRVVAVLLVLAIGGGMIFLAAWDMPAPSAPVVKVIPNDRFQS